MTHYSLNEPVASLVALSEFQHGGADATSFELIIADLAQWFIEHPDITWHRQLQDATAVMHMPSYRY